MDDWDRLKSKWMQNEEFRKAYEHLRPQYEVIIDAMRARLALGLSQEQLAQRMGRQQPSISRFEGASVMPSIAFLQDLAEALDLKLSVRLVPKDDAPETEERKRSARVGRRSKQKVSSNSNAR